MRDEEDVKPGQCSALTRGGSPCGSSAQQGSEFCFFHDPQTKTARLNAARLGGSRGSSAVLDRSAVDLTLDSAADVRRLLRETISKLLRGELDPRIGNCIARLLNCLKGLLPSDLDAGSTALGERLLTAAESDEAAEQSSKISAPMHLRSRQRVLLLLDNLLALSDEVIAENQAEDIAAKNQAENSKRDE